MANFPASSLQRKAALVAGIGLLAMAILAVGALMFIFDKIIVPGDAGATVNNILVGEKQFRIGIGCFLSVAILDAVVAWALYILLEPANKYLSMLAAWFRLVYSAILGVALFSYAHILQLLSGARDINGVGADQMHVDVMLSLRAFDDGWAIGLLFFGMHLLVLGYLVFKSGYVPKVLGIVLSIGGASYVTDSLGRFLLDNYTLDLAELLGWGELLFMLWLLFQGLKATNATLQRTP